SVTSTEVPLITTTQAPQPVESTTPTVMLTTATMVPLETTTLVFTVTPSETTTQQLTEEQKKNLETLAELEKEQAAILEQLSFLTSLNFGGNRGGNKKENSDLANRNSNKKKSTPSIEEVLKQYNLSGLDIPTPSSASKYGNSNDALLAALLKEQGISPSTPKSLADQIKQAVSTIFKLLRRGLCSFKAHLPHSKKVAFAPREFLSEFSPKQLQPKKPKPRKPTTRPPGRLMQGLNWLLNALAPPPQAVTRRPAKPVKPKKPPVDQELLANSPTRLTPVVTAAPRPFAPNALSQDDIQKLIKQLEAVQKDPKNADALDLSQIKSLQNLINTNEGVEVLTNSQNGATSRLTTTESTTTKKKQSKKEKGLKSTTVLPTTVSNDLDDVDGDDEELVATTVKPRPSLPPLKLRPVPGVDDNSDPLIRGNLITAAVNVTRAISGFLGSALQDAAYQFTHMFSSGSENVRNLFGGSSLASNVASPSASTNPSG
ncbi:hypothetical protein NQ314_014726, partial [Rhamnusium bicolor]